MTDVALTGQAVADKSLPVRTWNAFIYAVLIALNLYLCVACAKFGQNER
jgi:hypothetical protein